MPKRSRPLTGFLAICMLLGLCVVAGTPAPASAEKSVRKLKKKLHKMERKTGAVLKRMGKAVAAGLSSISIEFGSDDSSEDDYCSALQAPGPISKAKPPSPASAPPKPPAKAAGAAAAPQSKPPAKPGK